MTDLSLLPSTKASAQTLTYLWAATFRDAYADVHSAANLSAYCDNNFVLSAATATLADENTICKIAGQIEAPKGFYVLTRKTCPIGPKRPACELKQIYLLAPAYGTGLGKVLFEDAISEAGKMGAKQLWLSVSNENMRAQRFYEKLGFEHAGPGSEFHVGTDILTSSILTLQLD